MSRRDTIIVAVLINIALLGVLFMMALNTDLEKTEMMNPEIADGGVPIEMAASPVSMPAKEIVQAESSPRDEIDQVLKKYSVKTATPIGATPLSQNHPNELTLPPARDLLNPESSKYIEVTVKRGDYLEKIAKANGTTVSEIKRLNNLSSARIDIGQVLRLPVSGKKKPPLPKVEKLMQKEPEYYTLVSGDNPWKIAKKYHVGFNELLKLNDLDEEKARNLKPGDVLRVR